MAAGDDRREAGVEGFFRCREVCKVEERVGVVKNLQRGVGALDFADELIQEPRGFGLRRFWKFDSDCMFEERFTPGLKSEGRALTEEDGKRAIVGSIVTGCFTEIAT